MFLEFYRRVFRGLLVRRRAMVWPKGLIVLFCLIALAFLGVVDGRKKKGGKSKYQQALKCSSCIGAANEMREQIKIEWKDKGATILVEKRKKKTKTLYVESELSVHEALDKSCDESHYTKYSLASVEASPRYVKEDKGLDNKENKKKLSGTCQGLIADHEKELVDYFFQKKGNTDLLDQVEEEICVGISQLCTVDQFSAATKAAPPPPAPEKVEDGERNAAEGVLSNAAVDGKEL